MKTPVAKTKETVDFYFEYYHRVYEFYATAKYFYYPDTPEERSVASADTFFLNVAYASWALVVADLCKIFTDSSNQKNNLPKLLTNIKTQPNHKAILAKLGEPLIDEYVGKINQSQPTIEKLKILRDKHYAHVDDVTLDLNELKNPTFQETEVLLDLLKEIIAGFGEKVFDAQYDFPNEREIDQLTPRVIVQYITKQRSLSG